MRKSANISLGKTNLVTLALRHVENTTTCHLNDEAAGPFCNVIAQYQVSFCAQFFKFTTFASRWRVNLELAKTNFLAFSAS